MSDSPLLPASADMIWSGILFGTAVSFIVVLILAWRKKSSLSTRDATILSFAMLLLPPLAPIALLSYGVGWLLRKLRGSRATVAELS